MTLVEALSFNKSIKRKNKHESYGTIKDTGVTLLFCYPGINLNYSERLTLIDIVAYDWEVENNV